ncbi:MAG: hypothetical protein BA868_02595 [Desulfobacterales bacterium C00003106]|nr:MAG: hypothetical protein BA868_02595 [Desulfobacterales bacterium C00003106]OEU59540.1 MAG: hypothetical protein BAW33_03040 [Desulfobacterales bacterium C00003104]
MVAQLGYMNCIFRYFINESVFIIYSPGPIARKGMFKRLRLANAFKWITLCLFNEGIDTTEYLFIGFLPEEIILPGVVRKN